MVKAAVVDDDLLHEGQPETCTALLGREEGVEDLAHVRAGDPGPRVSDPEHHPARLAPQRDGEALLPLPARRRSRRRRHHRLAGVAYEVDERLAELRFIGGHLGETRLDVDLDGDPALRELAARQVDDGGDDRRQVLVFELRPRQAREPEVGLGDLGQPIDLADDRGDEPAGLAVARAHFVAEQLGVEADRRQRVTHLVRDLGRHPPHRRQPLGSDEAMLALLDRAGHGVELSRQIPDLVLRGDPRPLRVVAPCDLARPRAQHAERAERPEREDERRPRHGQAGGAEGDGHRQRRLLVVGQALGDLAALAPHRSADPVQAVGERREVALELGPRLGVDGHRRRAELPGQRVELAGEPRELGPLPLEVRPAR